MEARLRFVNKALLVLMAATALCAQAPVQWKIREAPPELRATITRADRMIASMHDSLLRELTQALSQVAPEKAINSCHVESELMSQRLTREGATAGRTSDRLRNPTNVPPPWAADLVTANAGRLARDVDGFAVDLGEKVGVLRPISLRPMCANCHGPADRLRPAVRAALAERYPADKAVGFLDGQIRGWFWVEMPKRLR